MDNGANTCFFESPDAVGDMTQSEYLEFDEDGLLDGEFPAYGTPEFDQVFHSPAVWSKLYVMPYQRSLHS